MIYISFNHILIQPGFFGEWCGELEEHFLCGLALSLIFLDVLIYFRKWLLLQGSHSHLKTGNLAMFHSVSGKRMEFPQKDLNHGKYLHCCWYIDIDNIVKKKISVPTRAQISKAVTG